MSNSPERTKDMSTLGLIAERYFEGVPAARIAADGGLHFRLVVQRLARMEALLLLLAHDFPVHLMARVMGLRPLEIHAYLDEVRDRIGDNERVREFVQLKGLLDSSAADFVAVPKEVPGSRDEALPSHEKAVKALEVLDFWASKWL